MLAFQSWCYAWAVEVYRVLKPGAHLVAFGGTRTHHRLMCALEDAGFEIRDTIAYLQDQSTPESILYASLTPEQQQAYLSIHNGASTRLWVYASGFPKSKRVDEAASHRYQAGDLCQCAASMRNSGNTYPLHSVLARICTADISPLLGHDFAPNDHGDSQRLLDSQGDCPQSNDSCDALLHLEASRVLAAVLPQEYAQERTRSVGNADDRDDESLRSLYRVLCRDLPSMRDYLFLSSWQRVAPLLLAHEGERCRVDDLHTLLNSTVDSLNVSALMRADISVVHTWHIRSLVSCLPLPILRILYYEKSDTIIPQLEMCGNCNGIINKWTGWGTALKPAYEPIVVARKPLCGTVAENVLRHGVGGMNIDGCRIEGDKGNGVWGSSNSTVNRARVFNDSPGDAAYRSARHNGGRWPANVVHDGSEEVLLAFPQASEQKGAVGPEYAPKQGTNCYGDYGPRSISIPCQDAGSAARFFYTAKASSAERGDGNTHPTVKPLALMRWLVRLVTPPGGLVLDPFLGSGTTALACAEERMRCFGIEQDAAYVALAIQRLTEATAQGVLL